jgi:heme/copper-type cytochrome/quinol oxidase subunit 2
MPIEVKVVSQSAFEAWAASAKKKFAAADEPAPAPTRVAALTK